ncbi:ABC transporter permease [uncultured Aquitalea sp.]|uniref:ABC transporter permease n=1 Tax=uncultured Aquitalea sp. TaxID=540272 RepID=UPI0025FEBF84|nr:ABC transporter permease [uncultured Aquitalea sp.]
MWYRLLTLIRKEMQYLLRNEQSRRLMIVPVILQLVLFPLAATLEVKNNSLAIYNQDSGAPAIELVQRLSSTQAFTHIEMVHGEGELRALIDRQQALIGITIPPDFSRKLASGQSAPLQAIIDGRRSNSAQIGYGYALQVVQAFGADLAAAPTPASVSVRHIYNPNLEYRWFVLPSLVAIITTLGSLMITALSLAREREEGNFEQLMVSPLTPAYIMVGKAVPALLVALMQGSVIALAAVWIYGMPFTGSVPLFVLSILCYGLSLVGFGLFISAVSSSQQQAFLGSFAFMAPAVILSGYVAPVENMPLPLRAVSMADPITHFIIIVKGLFLKGYGMAEVWPHLWPLLVIAAATLGLAYYIFVSRSQ